MKTMTDEHSVNQFALLMKKKLYDKRHKGHWRNQDRSWLFAQLIKEVGELAERLSEDATWIEIAEEAADVANFSMMVADVSDMGRLKEYSCPINDVGKALKGEHSA